MLVSRAGLFALVISVPLTSAAQFAASEKFEAVKVAKCVYAAIRKDSPPKPTMVRRCSPPNCP